MASTTTGRGGSGAITGINVTPLVDITLVLLIIFMVTAKLIVNKSAMTVDLPKAASGSEVQEIFSVVLALGPGPGAGPRTEVNGETLTSDDAILDYARRAAAKDRETRAVIKADGALSHARVMHVLDILREAGLSKIGFGVIPLPQQGAAVASPTSAPSAPPSSTPAPSQP